MMSDYGVGALGGVVLIDPETGLPYKASGGGGGGGGAVDSVNGQTGVVVLDTSDLLIYGSSQIPPGSNLNETLDTFMMALGLLSPIYAPPPSGTYTLQSEDGVLTWVAV